MKNYKFTMLFLLIFLSQIATINAQSKKLNLQAAQLFFIQNATDGVLKISKKNRGILTIHTNKNNLLYFSSNTKKPLLGHMTFYNFFNIFKKNLNKAGLNSVLVISGSKNHEKEKIFIVKVSHPKYNSITKKLSYQIKLLMEEPKKALHGSDTIYFNKGILLYDSVCISCVLKN